jgi:hypothetical protein
VIFVEKSLLTSRDYRKSDVTEEFVIERDFQFVVRIQRIMPELVRVQSVP